MPDGKEKPATTTHRPARPTKATHAVQAATQQESTCVVCCARPHGLACSARLPAPGTRSRVNDYPPRHVPLPAVAVVVPTLNAAPTIAATLASLVASGCQIPAEILVADGGSNDTTRSIAELAGARVIIAGRGRGVQLAAGVATVRSPWLLLLHADTRLDPGWQDFVRHHTVAAPGCAGYFRFALDSDDPRSRSLERAVHWRCRAFALPYGDQGLLIHRDLLAEIGGIRPLPLMEDVDLVRRLGRRRLVPLDVRAVTSARRWEDDGWRRRSLRNLLCLSLFFAGVPPRWIRLLYG